MALLISGLQSINKRGYKIQSWRKIQSIYKLHSLSLTPNLFSYTPNDHLFDDKEIHNFNKRSVKELD